MSPTTHGWTSQALSFIHKVGLREHPELKALRKRTDQLADGGMRSSIEQGQLLAFLIELTAARQVVEVGCFTGYGTLAMALALPEGGRITTLDVNDDWAAIGRDHWFRAGVHDRIDFVRGRADESLDRLIRDRGASTADLIYIDADKKSYDRYYESALMLARQGGVIALDNMLWGGAVADPLDVSRQAIVLRALNEKIHHDQRVTQLMVPIGDGLVLARKRGDGA